MVIDRLTQDKQASTHRIRENQTSKQLLALHTALPMPQTPDPFKARQHDTIAVWVPVPSHLHRVPNFLTHASNIARVRPAFFASEVFVVLWVVSTVAIDKLAADIICIHV